MEQTWKIEYENETGSMDEGFWEYWNVTDGDRCFQCFSEEDAQFLCDLLNTHAK